MRNMDCEVIIVGAGPIGIELAANFKRLGVQYLHLEGGQLAQTISAWPRSTPFFSSPERVAIAGVPLHSQHQSMITGEEYLGYLRLVVENFDLDILLYHRLLNLQQLKNGDFRLEVEHKGEIIHLSCKRLILANGNMHSPRRLGVPGEDLPHVDHYHSDVHRYFRQKLVVVGGKNSAVETAIRAWRAGAEVTILHRQPELDGDRLNSRYFLEISILKDKGKIAYRGSAQVTRITAHSVHYALHDGSAGQFRGLHDGSTGQLRELHDESAGKLQADFVRVCAGFDKDLSFLKQAGVTLDDELRPCLNPETMETDVPGLYLAGTAAGGGIASYKIFVGTSHVHVERIVQAVTNASAITGDYRRRSYLFTIADIEPTEGSSS